MANGMPKVTHRAQNSVGNKPNIILDGINGFDSADYGGSFTNYTPPTHSLQSDIRLVIDTNGAGAARLYVKANGTWAYTAFTKV